MKSLAILIVLIQFCSIQTSAQDRKDFPFFVFNSGVMDPLLDTPVKQALLLKETGYEGMELMGSKGLAETLSALDEHRLELFTIYLNVNLDDPDNAFDPQLKDIFRMIRGRKTMPWLYITSKKYRPSSLENDTIAVPILREIADMANEFGVRVMIYPHVNFWVHNVQDAVRVAAKVNRRNLGITFNLCHFLADHGARAQEAFIPTVELAMPYLFAISINGADNPTIEIMQDKNIWRHLIKPLGQGDYDAYVFVKAFVDRGFKGPVGLQCYNIPGPKLPMLRKSMLGWEDIWSRIESGRK